MARALRSSGRGSWIRPLSVLGMDRLFTRSRPQYSTHSDWICLGFSLAKWLIQWRGWVGKMGDCNGNWTASSLRQGSIHSTQAIPATVPLGTLILLFLKLNRRSALLHSFNLFFLTLAVILISISIPRLHFALLWFCFFRATYSICVLHS